MADTFAEVDPGVGIQRRLMRARVADHLANGASPSELGPQLDSLVQIPSCGPIGTNEGIERRLVSIDHFGNAITNIPQSMLVDLPNSSTMVASTMVMPIHQIGTLWDYREPYGQAAAGSRLALIGSRGYLELEVNGGAAAQEAGLQGGDRIVFATPKISSNG